MINKGSELIQTLKIVSTLEWYSHPNYDKGFDKPVSAKFVWRYDKNKTSEEVVQQIASAIQEALGEKTQIKWHFEYTGRNWFLCPEVLHGLCQSGKFRVDVAAELYLHQQTPSLFIKAYADILGIADAILRNVRIL